jgi:tetratricopeptide (TPR) repeat protein
MSRFLILSYLCLLISTGGYSQQIKGNFNVTGKVKVDQGVVDGTHIEVYQNSIQIQDVIVNRTGNFRVSINLGQVYRFQFLNDLYYSKTIEIDTHVPPEACKVDCAFPPYELSLLLYKKVPGVPESAQQIGKVSYNPKIDNFDAEILRQETDLKAMIDGALADVKQKSVLYENKSVRDKKQNYDRLISEGNNYFNSGNLNQAMLSYRDAAMIFPLEKYPRDRVDLAYQMLVFDELSKNFGQPSEDNFLKYLNYGDLKFADREYTVAKVAYESALKVRPDEQKIISKLQKSDEEVQKTRELSRDEIIHRDQVYSSRIAKYNELIVRGDEIFRNQDIVGAKDLYAQAATQISENSYALLILQKIGEIVSNDELSLKLAHERDEAEKKRLADARNQAYIDAVAEADRQFDQRLYRDALETYELALTIKSYEFYPKKQISEINSILAKLQLKGEEYNRLLRDGELFLQEKEYLQARSSFVQAHDLITDEKYALQKITEIDLMLEQAKLDGIYKAQFLEQQKQERANQAQFDQAIAEADNLFKSKKYKESIIVYQKASEYKPSEKYPREQILMIRGILSRDNDDQKRLLQQQTDYDQAILQADNAFNKQSYQLSRSFYQKALHIFPGQEYPTSQVKKIDGLLAGVAANLALSKSKLEQIDFTNLENVSNEDRETAYKEAMSLGESFMKSQEWAVARFYFKRALSLFPNDVTANKKLIETEQMIRGNDVNESKYIEMVKKADESFKTGDISVAKFYYSKALEAKPGDNYVKERIEVADQLLRSTAERAENREIDDAIGKGNEAFDTKNFILARFYFRKALSLRSDNQIAKDKIDKCEQALSQDKSDASQSDYDRNISSGDQAFKQQKYSLATSYYKKALTIKPGDAYPLSQLSKIEGLLKK